MPFYGDTYIKYLPKEDKGCNGTFFLGHVWQHEWGNGKKTQCAECLTIEEVQQMLS